MCVFCMRGSRGGGAGGPDSLRNHKNIGFISKYWSRTVEKPQCYKASIQCWAIVGTPAKRHLNGVSPTGRWWPANGSILILSSTKFKNKLDPSDKTFWIRARMVYVCACARACVYHVLVINLYYLCVYGYEANL